jgi:SNF2 family DNA or RNA helicase
LADEMGLGKTISAIAMIVTLWTTFPDRVGPALIVCPATVIKQWEQEIKLWTNDTNFKSNVYTFNRTLKDAKGDDSGNVSRTDKQRIVQQVFKEGALLVISYESMRIDADLLAVN